MSPDQITNISKEETKAIFSMGNPPGQLELLQRALQKSKSESHEKDKKIRESTTNISALENSLAQEITRVDELETDLDEKTTEIKELRATVKRGEKEYALLQESHRAAEEQSTKDAQEIRDLRIMSRKQRGAQEASQKEIRELDEGNGQLRGELVRAKELAAKELADTAYQRGLNDAHALVREASKIENPGPWGGSLATSRFSSRVASAMTSARMSMGSAGQEHIYTPSRSHTGSVPGLTLTLEQELADISDESGPPYESGSSYESNESPWTKSDRTDSYDHLHEYALVDEEPYQIQADLRDAPPLGKSDLTTETAFKSDQPHISPAVHKPDLSEGRQKDPGVRMVLMSTLAWWWQILGAKRVLSKQEVVASGVASGVVASLLMILGFMWWTDGAWQWQQANQSPWSVYHERCITLGSDSRWLFHP